MAALGFASRVRALKRFDFIFKVCISVSVRRTINETKEKVVVMLSLCVDFC